MFAVDQGMLAIEGVPDVYGAIKAGRCDTRTIRRPARSKEAILFIMGIEVFPACGLPDLDGIIPIVASGSYISSVR
jgi:hypothetical protein